MTETRQRLGKAHYACWGRKRAIVRLFERDGSKCSICGSEMLFSIQHKSEPRFATADHILPRSKGGSNAIENLRLACKSCNEARGDRYHASMGGVGKQRQVASQTVSPSFKPPEPTVYAYCCQCGTRYAVFEWSKPGGLCPLCVCRPTPPPGRSP